MSQENLACIVGSDVLTDKASKDDEENGDDGKALKPSVEKDHVKYGESETRHPKEKCAFEARRFMCLTARINTWYGEESGVKEGGHQI